MAFMLPKALAVTGVMKEASPVRPVINVGGIFDIPNHIPVKGKWGNVIVNGGLWPSTGVSGPNNSGKSTLSKYFLLAVFDRCKATTGISFDTEVSGTSYYRYNQLAERFEHASEINFEDTDRWTYTTNVEMFGDEWWSSVKDYCDAKVEARKETEWTTPMVDKDGNYIKGFIPTVAECDSISSLNIKSVEDKYIDLSAGDAKRNMEDMANMKAKTKIVRDMPVVCNRSGLYLILTAHIGKKFDLDPYNPSMRRHQFQKGNRTLKYVPEQFDYLINNYYDIIDARPLINNTTKAPEFPRHQGDDVAGDTDLTEMTITIVRGKGGGSGMTFPLISSQAEGVLAELSQFWYLKCWKEDSKSPGWGLEGNLQNYALIIYPDCKLSRTTVRGKIDSDAKLRRALQITCDLLMLHHIDQKKIPAEYRERICDIKTLYDDIKALGYDWNDILENTIGEWKFREECQEKPTLTIYDLLNIRAGVYTPYWKQEAWLKEKRKDMAP
nr:MAG TPA: RNase L inhibitor-like protein [Caudoviricetes sp.]